MTSVSSTSVVLGMASHISSAVPNSRREATRWRVFFGGDSDSFHSAFAALTKFFFQHETKVGGSFELWRRLWRASSAATFDARTRAALEPYRIALDGDSATALGAQDETTRIETLLFLLQTYVAQTVLAVVAVDFALDDDALDELFAPFPYAWGAPVRRALNLNLDALQPLKLHETARTRDPFGAVYERFFSAPLRRALGEFYTPPALAEFLYDRARALKYGAEADAATPTVLDPTCGAGVFLTTAIRRALRDGRSPADALGSVYGNDLNPLAAIIARANLLYAALSQQDASSPTRRRAELVALLQKRNVAPDALLPVDLLDAVSLASPIPDSNDRSEIRRARKFDLALGNPPWIAWDKLPREYRVQTSSRWRDYGLFTLSGREARFGGAKKELAGLIATICVAERLVDDGVAAFILPRNLFQSSRAGEGFRRFGADAPWRFAALEFDDFSELKLFPRVASKPTALFVRARATTRYPIVARRWSLGVETVSNDASPELTRAARAFGATFDVGTAAPASARSGAAFALTFPRVPSATPTNAEDSARRRVDALVEELLESAEETPETPRYRAQLGANAAGACGVFWFEGTAESRLERDEFRNLAASGRRKVPSVSIRLEKELLHPLVRWRDLDEFHVAPTTVLMLVPQDARRRRGFDLETMRSTYPLTLAHLERFEDVLRARAACKRFCRTAPYWSLFNVDESTFASYKVAWRRMDSQLRAAVVAPTSDGRPVLVQETLAFVPVANAVEADYLAAALNSAPARRRAAERFEPGSQSFGSPGVLDAIPIPRFAPKSPICLELATLGARLRRDAAVSRRV